MAFAQPFLTLLYSLFVSNKQRDTISHYCLFVCVLYSDRQFTLMITAVFNTFKLSNGYGRPIFVQKLIDASTLLTQCKFLAKTHKIKILEGLLRIFLDVIGPSVILAKCFDSTDTHFFVYVYTFATRFFFCNLLTIHICKNLRAG